MKHKAQGSLNYLVAVSCPKQVSCKECNISHRCNSLAKDYVDDVQQLIDCQLTKEEINVIQVCMSYYSLRHNEKPEINGINVDCCEGLFNKLQNQKEMWEVE